MKTLFVSRKDFQIPDASLVLLQDHNIEDIRDYLVKDGFTWFGSFEDDGPLSESKNFEVDSVIFINQDDKTITKVSKSDIDKGKLLMVSWDIVLDITFVEI
mgnify:CR=1 FL=1